MLFTTQKITPKNTEVILSIQNSLLPGNNGKVSPSQNYLQTIPGTKESLQSKPKNTLISSSANNRTASTSQNYFQTIMDNKSILNDNIGYLQLLIPSVTSSKTPATHKTIWQDMHIKSFEFQLTFIRDYTRSLEHQINKTIKKLKHRKANKKNSCNFNYRRRKRSCNQT